MLKRTFAAMLAVLLAVSATACSEGETTSSDAGTSSAVSSGELVESETSSEVEPTEDGTSGDSVELRVIWWGSQTRHDYTLAAIEVFESKNSGITIAPEYVAPDGYWQKLSTFAAASDLPDVIQQDYRYIVQYMRNGLMVDLNPYVESGVLNLDDCDRANWEGGIVDGKLSAVCLGVNSVCTLINKEMLDQIGEEVPPMDWTWEDYEALCDKFLEHQEELGIDYVDNSTQGNCLEQISYSFRENDMWFYNQDGSESFAWEKEEGRPIICEFLNREKEYREKNYTSPLAVRDEAQVNGAETYAIIRGESAMATGVWSNLAKAVSNAAGKTFAITSFPAKTEKRMQYIKPSQFFSVSANSENPEEAVVFINAVTNDIDMNMELKGERGVPISTKVREALAATYDEDSMDKAIFDYITELGPIANKIWVPEPKASGAITTLQLNMLKDVVDNGISAEDAFDSFYDQAMLEFQMAQS